MDPIKTSVEVVKGFAQVPEDNKDSKQAGEKFARVANIVATTIDNALLPLAALNFGFAKARAYFEGRFAQDVQEKLKSIPPEDVIEPKPSVVGPALQGLAFSHDEVDLKSMYLNLISSSMNRKTARNVHPSFVEVIKQLGAEEANLLYNVLSVSTRIQVVDFRKSIPGALFEMLAVNVINLQDENGPLERPETSVWVENWMRLGLVSKPHTGTTLLEDYDWVFSRPEYKRITRMVKRREEINVIKGMLVQSDYGISFRKCVGIPDPPAERIVEVSL